MRGFVILPAIFTIVVLTSGGRAGASGSYNPGATARYCNALPTDFPSTIAYDDYSLLGSPGCADPAPIALGYPYDTTFTFSLGPGEYQFRDSVGIVLSPDHFIAGDSSINDGEKIGGVVVGLTVALLNNVCNTALTSEFVLYDATTTGIDANPLPPGSANPLSSLVTDPDLDSFGNPSSRFVTAYPSFYDALFDPDLDYPGGPNGPVQPVRPRARYTGMTRVPAVTGDWQILSVLQFAATDLAVFAADAHNRPAPFGRLGRAPGDGQIYVVVLGDDSGAQASAGTVTDLCPPLAVTLMLKGVSPGGKVRFRTPPTNGTRIIGTWSYSQRDADGDGIENQLDTCPFAANTGVDSDGDGIDNACDAAYTPNNSDVDGDGFSNRQDNCPQIANGGAAQRDGENATTYIIAAPNGGPKTDGIGDACDPHPTVADGSFIEKYNFVAKCIGPGPDADGDGYCAAEDGNDNSAGVRGYSLNGGSDVDGVDALAGGDRFNSNVEYYVGTDPLDRCNDTYAPNDEPLDAWPADFNDDRVIDITDVLTLKPIFGGAVPPLSTRYDIAPSKVIDISDVLATKDLFGLSC